MTEGPVRHVLGLSGGRDSAALAVYMRQHYPDLKIEYFFTDTGKELPEVHEFLGRLEGLSRATDRAPKSGPGFRFLAYPVQAFSAIPANTVVHPSAEDPAVRTMAAASLGGRDQDRQLCRHPVRRGLPGRLYSDEPQHDGSPTLQGKRDRQGRSAGNPGSVRRWPA